ncbi:hypothetical protein [Paenibacillus thalictri]|uniref:Beta-hexosaminidase bacterial type N-terminal domain-containing protein n=1 Tax=Paenibacillus thalictri TaxID=2527873 RepID=A0A4Q9DT66_9BACL|nr:hypothetical protein [Paenibacillus thalictri]TBL80116.1 hypothetical protein EYB31_06725 [Paenibacillus thalictri]
MTIPISYSEHSTQIGLAVQKLKQALNDHTAGGTPAEAAGIVIVAGNAELASHSLTLDGSVEPEGYEIRRSDEGGTQVLYILAADETGAMYGAFEVAEQLRRGRAFTEIAEGVINARFPFRALKFNLPWSSYRMNECFDLQRETVKDLAFWRKFLDMMAENRYNALTLWNLHPFPYMFRTAGFPKATPFTDEELAEWKTYWTALFRMAKERGIETYLVDWNIFVSESFREHYDANAISDESFFHYGDSYSTEQIKQYTRECVTQLIREYPDLTGLGISLGERMNDMTPQDRQQWIEDVYYEGLKQAGRTVKFIHRAPFSVDPLITRTSIETNGFLPEPVWVEVKFNWSHAYSSPKLLMTHGGSNGMEGYWNPAPQNYKITWMVRNEDFFTLRWAQPDFIRAHIAENGQDYVGGYYVGSECFIPGADYSHIPDSPHIHWTYAFEKHWLYYMLWGRLLYDPSTPDAVFADALTRRFGPSAGQPLLEAYSHVCKMPMALGSFYSFTWDFTLYAEGFLATDQSEYNGGKAFISLEDLLNGKTLDPSFLSLRHYVERLLSEQPVQDYVTPLQLADQLEADASRGLAALSVVSGESPALCCEKADIEAWAYLSLYFAAKLRAGVNCELFARTGDEAERSKALTWLSEPHAAKHWDDLIRVTKAHYKEQPLMHLGKTPFTWELFRQQVWEDIAFVEALQAPGK